MTSVLTVISIHLLLLAYKKLSYMARYFCIYFQLYSLASCPLFCCINVAPPAAVIPEYINDNRHHHRGNSYQYGNRYHHHSNIYHHHGNKYHQLSNIEMVPNIITMARNIIIMARDIIIMAVDIITMTRDMITMAVDIITIARDIITMATDMTIKLTFLLKISNFPIQLQVIKEIPYKYMNYSKPQL